MLKFILFVFIFFIFVSCGKTIDEKTADAILSANISLSRGDCSSAINVLESNGRVNDNAVYLKTLSSAYACRAGFSTLTLFTSDLSKIITLAATGPLNGLATFTTSTVGTVYPLQYESTFMDMQTAINILLFAGGIPSTVNPSATERAKYFSSADAGDINAQLLYLMLAQLGKFMYVYGDSSAAGVKGGGSASNLCFTSYGNTNVAVQGAIATSGATCNSVNSSHAQLVAGVDTATSATRKTRLCHGVILLNGVLELLPNVVASLFTDPTDAAAVNAAIANFNNAKVILAGLDNSLGVVLTTVSQNYCEDNITVPLKDIETYYAGIFESVFK